jgi:hypothetical protein
MILTISGLIGISAHAPVGHVIDTFRGKRGNFSTAFPLHCGTCSCHCCWLILSEDQGDIVSAAEFWERFKELEACSAISEGSQ